MAVGKEKIIERAGQIKRTEQIQRGRFLEQINEKKD